jgi:hypothetical protein
MRVCAIVPTYNNPATVAIVVRTLCEHLGEVVVVDDGGGREAREILDELATLDGVTLVRRERNGGKGAAVKAGLERAAQLGATHALQVDADGQHDLRDVPTFVEAIRAHPEALVLGTPRFDSSAPLIRRFGRKLTQFWNRIETVGRVIDDPMRFSCVPGDRSASKQDGWKSHGLRPGNRSTTCVGGCACHQSRNPGTVPLARRRRRLSFSNASRQLADHMDAHAHGVEVVGASLVSTKAPANGAPWMSHPETGSTFVKWVRFGESASWPGCAQARAARPRVFC